MAIIARIVKIFKADIHGVMDQLEDRGLLLKQHLRDMEEALNHKQAKLRKMTAPHNQGQKDLAGYKQQWEALDHDLTVAVRKNKDDIARMLIRKMKPLENLSDELTCHLKTLDEEMIELNSACSSSVSGMNNSNTERPNTSTKHRCSSGKKM